MSSLANSHECLQFAVILVLMISLILPVSVLMNPIQNTESSLSPIESVSLAVAPMLELTYLTLS